MKTLVINKKDLAHNINVLQRASKNQIIRGGSDYQIIAVVKGNGYGLGLIEYSKFLIDNGINILAVSTVEEALELKKAGIEKDIIMLSATAIKEELELLVKENIIITIGSKDEIKILNQMAEEGKNIRAHIKVDTGFGRYGFIYNDKNLKEDMESINQKIKVEGVFSHFSLSYYQNNKWTEKQFDRFLEALDTIREIHKQIEIMHICNSSGYLNYPTMHLNAARVGSAFLGRIDGDNKLQLGLKKIGKIKTKISEIKTVPKGFNIGYLNVFKTKNQTTIATIPVGYMDGYNLGIKTDMFRPVDKLRDIKHTVLKKSLKIIINDKIYPVIGKIGMYHTTINITDSDIKVGDEVYLDVNPLYVDSRIRREFE